MLIRTVLVGVMSGLVLCECAAVDPPAPSDADALRGPSVVKNEERLEHSIVQRDFNGRLKRLDEHPVLVALARLDLSPVQRKAADKALGDRAATLDTIVRDNLRQIIEYAGAEQAGEKITADRLRKDLLEKARPFLKRGSMISELVPALPEDKLAELRKMVGEYNRLSAQDRAADRPNKDKPAPRMALAAVQGLENFGAEIKASVQRVIEGGGKEFEQLLTMLELRPDQEAKIRRKAEDFFQQTYGKATKGQQIRFILSVYGDLDKEQRHRLTAHLGEEAKAARAAAAAARRESTPEPPEIEGHE